MNQQLEIYHGAPADIDGRQEREQRVYRLLDSLGIDYERVDHDPAMTMEVCDLINQAFHRTTVEHLPDDPTGAVICKNLFLTNKQHTRHYLLMMPGDKKFLTKNLSAQINSARLSFASAEEMLEMLDITPGSVSVMGLMNDHDNHVQLLIDRDILRGPCIGFHPCINTSSLRMRTHDLIDRVIPALNHSPIYVDL